MKKPQINWERLAPVGLDGKREAVRACWALAGSALWSLGAPIRMAQCWRWIEEARMHGSAGFYMRPFSEIMGSALWGFALTAAWLLALAARHYVYHRQESRVDYLMRRLPDPWEYRRRCWAIPLAGILASAVLALALWGFYWWLYITFTPPECLRDVAIVTVETIR